MGDPVQRAQEQVAVLIQEQIQDSVDTVRRLMTCTSLPAAVSVQVEATGRAVARLVAHGQAMAAVGREMVRA
ncbi:MAG TPA: phasin family protein, partial [Geminicoccaceae bacterium]